MDTIEIAQNLPRIDLKEESRFHFVWRFLLDPKKNYLEGMKRLIPELINKVSKGKETAVVITWF